MWFPSKAFDVLKIATESVQALREENSSLKAKLASIETELIGVKINSDWLRLQVNQLQLERTGLIEKAYSIRLPVPELQKAPRMPKDIFSQALFEDQSALETTYGA